MLDVYEDWRQPVAQRVEDLLAQMTLQDKAGLMQITVVQPEQQPG
jgi:beta-glucosidase